MDKVLGDGPVRRGLINPTWIELRVLYVIGGDLSPLSSSLHVSSQPLSLDQIFLAVISFMTKVPKWVRQTSLRSSPS